MTLPALVKKLMKALLIVLGVVAALFAVFGLLTFLRDVSCNRPDAVRVSYLEPGHDIPGPGSIYVKGVGPGPPRSQIVSYLEAEAEMKRAGCDLPAVVGP